MATRPRIMVIDDEEDLRSSVADVLRCLMDVDVVEVPSGPDAIAEQRRHPADAVVVDFRMPRMNGLDTTAGLKAITPGLGVVMFTAYQDGALMGEALRQGIDRVLGKPSRAEDLVEAVEYALAESRVRPGHVLSSAEP